VGREGYSDLTFELEKDADRRRKSTYPGNSGTPAGSGGSSRADMEKNQQADRPELGLALKTVYQRTVEEDIPPEMLDLLGKLG